MKALWWIWMWAITGSGTPFMWTVTVHGVGGQNVTAEASLAKEASSWGDPRHVKTSVYSYTQYGLQTGNWWGIDGPPIRYLTNVGYMTFALEVQRAYGVMTGKLYVH
jgi:hypothetical protein